MRLFLCSLSLVSLLLLPACGFRSDTAEAEVSPAASTPIFETPPVAAADEKVEQSEPPAVSRPADSEFTLDPAPAPPTEPSPASAEQPSPEPSSAEDVFNSIGRVLRGAIEGTGDETRECPQGSVVGSIGRALSKGFQAAAVREDAAGEDALDE